MRAVLLTVAALAAAPAPAWATQCDWAPTQAYWGASGPDDGAPTDTWVWDPGTWSTWTWAETDSGYTAEPVDADVELLGPAGVVPTDPVTLLLRSLSSPLQVGLAPREALAPDTEYEVALGYGTTTFRTGSGAAAPPDVPSVAVHLGESRRWYPERGLEVAYRVHADGAWMYAMDVDRFSERAQGRADLVATAVQGARRPGYSVEFSFSNAPCARGWGRFELADGQLVRFGAWNLAGEFSGWSDEIPMVILDPGRPRFHCATPPAGGAWAAAAGLAAAWRRRRFSRRGAGPSAARPTARVGGPPGAGPVRREVGTR